MQFMKNNMNERNRSENNKTEKSTLLPQNLSVPQYNNPAGDEYPVIAVNNYLFPNKTATTEEEIKAQVQTIKDCGFNVSIWICRGIDELWRDQISTYYKVSNYLGLRTIYNLSNQVPVVKVKDYELNKTQYKPTLDKIAEILNLNKGNDNLWGYNLADEPKYQEWAYTTPTAVVNNKDLLAMFRTYLQNANGHVALFNLVALVREYVVGKEIYDSHGTNMAKYQRYLRAIKYKFNPSLLSIDIYPITKSKSNTGPQYTILERYYYILEAVGNFSTQYDMPFWMYLLCNQFNSYNDDGSINAEFPKPTEGILRFQALTALAYGFQALVFWTYSLHTNNMKDNPNGGDKILVEEFLDAPYVDGHTTEIWDNCKAIIPEIKQYGKELLGAKFQGARHVYGPLSGDPYKETTKFESSIGCIVGASSNGQGFVITHLKKGNYNYMAIVSHNPDNMETIEISIPLNCFWHEINYNHIDANKGPSSVSMRYNGDVKILTRHLKPGGMILIRY